MSPTILASDSPSIRTDRKRPKARAAKTDDQPTVKATIVMPRKLHALLTSVAAFQGLDGSVLATNLIERGLKERHSAFYEALNGFKAKPRASKVSPDEPGDTNESAA